MYTFAKQGNKFMKGSNVGKGIQAVSCSSYLSNFSNALHSCKETPTSSTSAAKVTAVASITSVVCRADEKAVLKVRVSCFQHFFLTLLINAVKVFIQTVDKP